MKPLKISKVPSGYHVFLHGVPLVKGDNGTGVTVDRAKAGLSTTGFKGGYKTPIHTEPLLIKKKEDAIGLAHQVGRYMLNTAWWNRASR
jgi:hypothetical protein